jgi:hypothetical protein
MDLTAWFGLQGVFSSDDAAHIFGPGPVAQAPPCQSRPVLSFGRACARALRAAPGHLLHLRPAQRNFVFVSMRAFGCAVKNVLTYLLALVGRTRKPGSRAGLASSLCVLGHLRLCALVAAPISLDLFYQLRRYLVLLVQIRAPLPPPASSTSMHSLCGQPNAEPSPAGDAVQRPESSASFFITQSRCCSLVIDANRANTRCYEKHEELPYLSKQRYGLVSTKTVLVDFIA